MRTIVGCGLFAAVAACLAGAGCEQEPPSVPMGAAMEYRTRMYFPGLDETVEVVKTPWESVAIRASGRRQPLDEVRAFDASAMRQRFGKMSEQLAHRIADPGLLDEDGLLPIVIGYVEDVDWSLVRDRVTGADAEQSAAEIDAVALALAERAAPLAERWSGAGVRVERASTFMPVIFGKASPDVIEELSEDPDVAFVTDDVPRSMVEHQAYPPSGMVDPDITDVFNTTVIPGFDWADGVHVGIYEGDPCGLEIAHDAFQVAVAAGHTPVHSSPLPSTTGGACSAQCPNIGDALAYQGECINGHATRVASVILGVKTDGSLNPKPYGPSAAKLHMYNSGGGKCSVSEQDAAYTWFLQNRVFTVNESWGCGSADPSQPDLSANEGMVQDHFARVYGILPVKAAPNNGDVYEEIACPSTLNSECVGGSEKEGTLLASFSATLNPVVPLRTDREEPDIMALAKGVHTAVLGAVNEQSWEQRDATSFAAPAVTALATLLKASCPDLAKDDIFIRMMLDRYAFRRNPDGWRYQTPAHGVDGADGAGSIEANSDMLKCPERGTSIDLTGGTPLPGGRPPPDGPPPEQIQSSAPPDHWTRRGIRLRAFTGTAGKRLRAGFFWDSCPVSSYLTTPPPTLGVDFDLFLVKTGTSGTYYVYGSQSLFDNREGFDVTLPESGTYEIWVSYPANGLGCGSSTREAYWAYADVR